MEGFVYAIRTKGAEYVKVGMAVDVEARIRQMQSGSAHRLYVYATRQCSDMRTFERQMHSLLREYRVQNAGGREWFYWNKDTRPIIRSNLAKVAVSPGAVLPLPAQEHWTLREAQAIVLRHGERAVAYAVEDRQKHAQAVYRLAELVGNFSAAIQFLTKQQLFDRHGMTCWWDLEADPKALVATISQNVVAEADSVLTAIYGREYPRTLGRCELLQATDARGRAVCAEASSTRDRWVRRAA